MREVAPLGIFGRIASQSAFSRLAGELREDSGAIPYEERAVIAEYLRNAPVVIALMGYTEDILGGRFSVTGGSAIHSDGRYFWRRDAAEYIEHYGTRLPDAFLLAGRKDNWRPARLSQDEVLDIDDYFMWLRSKRAADSGDTERP
ncbi:hypothetical protein [Streptomyces sp. NPDC000880]